MPSSLRLLVGAVVASTVLAACGSSETPSSAAGTTTGTTGAGATTTGTGGAGGSGGVGGNGGGGATGTGGAGFTPAPHTAFPSLTFHGDASFAHPALVTITFPGYARKAEAEAFGDFIVTSSWVTTTGAEYGVGTGTHLAKVTLPDAAPPALDDAGLVAILGQRIADGTLPDKTIADEVIYMAYIPASTAYTDDGLLCNDYLGYHWETMVNGKHIAYAVIGDCDAPFEDVTSTAAHELIETATDAVNGWYLDPAETDPWVLLSGNENADLCQDLPNVMEGGFAVQRSWSKVAADAGGSPCAPVPDGEIYYSVTAQPEMVPQVAAGSSVTFTLTGWSSAKTAPWKLSIDDLQYYDFVPAFALSGDTIDNGGTVTLKLTVPAGTPSGQIGGVVVDSGDGYGRYWPVTVIVK